MKDVIRQKGVSALIAGIVVDRADREEGHLVVEFELVGDLGDAGLQREVMLWYHQSMRSCFSRQSGVQPKSAG